MPLTMAMTHPRVSLLTSATSIVGRRRLSAFSIGRW